MGDLQFDSIVLFLLQFTLICDLQIASPQDDKEVHPCSQDLSSSRQLSRREKALGTRPTKVKSDNNRPRICLCHNRADPFWPVHGSETEAILNSTSSRGVPRATGNVTTTKNKTRPNFKLVLPQAFRINTAQWKSSFNQDIKKMSDERYTEEEELVLDNFVLDKRTF